MGGSLKSCPTSDKALSTLKKLSGLLFLTEGGKRTMVQAALRFILDTEGVTVVIPGAKSRKQLEENAGAVDVPSLTPEERARAIAAIPRPRCPGILRIAFS